MRKEEDVEEAENAKKVEKLSTFAKQFSNSGTM